MSYVEEKKLPSNSYRSFKLNHIIWTTWISLQRCDRRIILQQILSFKLSFLIRTLMFRVVALFSGPRAYDWAIGLFHLLQNSFNTGGQANQGEVRSHPLPIHVLQKKKCIRNCLKKKLRQRCSDEEIMATWERLQLERHQKDFSDTGIVGRSPRTVPSEEQLPSLRF